MSDELVLKHLGQWLNRKDPTTLGFVLQAARNLVREELGMPVSKSQTKRLLVQTEPKTEPEQIQCCITCRHRIDELGAGRHSCGHTEPPLPLPLDLDRNIGRHCPVWGRIL